MIIDNIVTRVNPLANVRIPLELESFCSLDFFAFVADQAFIIIAYIRFL